MLITVEQMWTRFRTVQKKCADGIRCTICKEHIYAGEKDIVYVKTKRGTEIFVHKDCMHKW